MKATRIQSYTTAYRELNLHDPVYLKQHLITPDTGLPRLYYISGIYQESTTGPLWYKLRYIEEIQHDDPTVTLEQWAYRDGIYHTAVVHIHNAREFLDDYANELKAITLPHEHEEDDIDIG